MSKFSVLFSLIFALFIGFALSSCGGDDSEPNPPPTTDGQVSSPGTDGGGLPPSADSGDPGLPECKLDSSKITAKIDSSAGLPQVLFWGIAGAVEPSANLWYSNGGAWGSISSKTDGSFAYSLGLFADAGDSITLKVEKKTCKTVEAKIIVK